MAIRRGNVTYDDMEYQQGPRAEALVSSLEPLLSAPRKQIEKYMKLRSKRSVDKLTDIMQEYSNVAHGDYHGSELDSQAGGEMATFGDGTDAATQLANVRKERGLAWKSTYTSFHSTNYNRSKSAGGAKKSVGSGAFDKVWRNGEKPQLERWKEATTDDKIKQLADACRGIYSLEDQEAGPRSEYRKRYGRAANYCTPRVYRDRNRSEVPIGSIYSTDPWELEASAAREKDASDALRRVADSQDIMMNHKKHPKKPMQLTYIDRYKMNKYKESAEVTGCLMPQSRAIVGTGRSEYRAKYIAHT
jgi:hypothetical protein